MKLELISQGAEAKILAYKDLIFKLRLSKEYRHFEIDYSLIKSRTKIERKILFKLSEANIPVPKIFTIPEEFIIPNLSKKVNISQFSEIIKNQKDIEKSIKLFSPFNTICMERIEGISLKKADLNYKINYELGELVRKIHDLNIIHGDLTTENFILKDKIYIIDFGLSFYSTKDEDKAVDLYVLERAFQCLHGELDGFYDGYKESSVLEKLKEVRRRGRKRDLCSFG